MGLQNVYIGAEAGRNASSGQGNVYLGWHAGFNNTSGDNNVFLGLSSGFNTTGSQNVFLGTSAGDGITSNGNNIAIGFEAGFSGNFTNSTVIGAGAECNANNKIRLGNASVNVIEGQVAFSSSSDRRLKRNIVDCTAGLDFINELRPVQYQWKEGQGDKIFTGFIAQEVEVAAEKTGFDFSAIKKPANETDYYSLRYAEFVVPLVKAVQELYQRNMVLEKEVMTLSALLQEKTNGVSTASR